MNFRVKKKGGGLKAALIAIFKSAVYCVKWSRGRDGRNISPHFSKEIHLWFDPLPGIFRFLNIHDKVI